MLPIDTQKHSSLCSWNAVFRCLPPRRCDLMGFVWDCVAFRRRAFPRGIAFGGRVGLLPPILLAVRFSKYNRIRGESSRC